MSETLLDRVPTKSSTSERIVEVAVHLPVYGTYYYSVPDLLGSAATIGSRVQVPFGNRGVSGVIVGEPDGPVEHDVVRPIDALVDGAPLIPEDVVDLCQWVASYYEAPPGEALRAALPVGAAVVGRQEVVLTDKGTAVARGDAGALPSRLRDRVLELAASGGRMAQKKFLASRATSKDLHALVEAGFVEIVREFARRRVREKTIRVATLRCELTDELRETMKRKKRQLEVLAALAASDGEATVDELKEVVPRASAHLRALADAGLVEVTERVATPEGWREEDALPTHAPAIPPTLNPAQSGALDAVLRAARKNQFRSFLLHGITGSGKTEVYLHVIADVIERGLGAIVLVPEISLTPQLAARFRARFGDAVAVLHSGLTDRQRFDEWHRIRRGDARIALGARSAVFAPVADLGVVIVDEEHDSSFKQEEGVRYHGRDVALVRAQRAAAVCVMGSATPSLETFYSAEKGRHQLLTLPERATPKPLPVVETVDLRRHGVDADSYLSAPLRSALDEVLRRGEQAILFLNRRGFHTFVLCTGCGHAFRCRDCSVSLTHHQHLQRLVCHHCGRSERLPETCPECGGQTIAQRGMGTERVAAGVAAIFPKATVDRLDRDVAAARGIESVLRRFGERKSDILVGTQMVTKGHDFPGVTLVGVLSADAALSLPDFRASERTFQLLTQVAGRAGRGDIPGRVIVQTYRPTASAVACACRHDFLGFYESELAERRDLGYPPVGYLVAVRVDGRSGAEVQKVARELARCADHTAHGVHILGPSEAPLARIAGRTRWHFWLSALERKSLRQVVRKTLQAAEATPSSVRVTVDVDPISAL